MRTRVTGQCMYILMLFVVCGCKTNTDKDAPTDAAWVKVALTNGWQVRVPPGFVYKAATGVDSDPGYITSKSDSVYLTFDSGKQRLKDVDCSFAQTVKTRQDNIRSDYYKEVYHISKGYRAYLDTIDNKAAVIVRSQPAEGTLGVDISDCETGKWLNITGRKVPAGRQKLVLQIFNTIELTK